MAISAAGSGHQPPESGLGHGYHLYSDGTGLCLSGCCLDWFSRRALSWRVSLSMEADFCVEAGEEALGRHGTPEIFNTDQGNQFTSEAFTSLLSKYEITISMDGKGA